MNIEIDITGIDNFVKTINSVSEIINETKFRTYLGQKAIEVINDVARTELKSSDDYINHNTLKVVNDGIIIYNDIANSQGQHYSLILEYGSGTYKEMGTYTSEPTTTYDMTNGLYWLVPIEKAENLSAYYDDTKIVSFKDKVTGEEVKCYKVFGQYPHHIYEKAARKIKEEIAEWAVDYINKKMK